MTDDIVARLRDWSITIHTLEQEAADEIERLRAELAAEREAKQCAVDQAETFREERDAMFAALCTLRARRQIVYSPDAQAMSDRVKAAEAERDALRAELAAERDRAEAHFLAAQEADDELATIRAERDALRKLLCEARDWLTPDPADDQLLARIDAALKGDDRE